MINKKLLIVFAFFLLLVLFFYFVADFDIDALYMKNAFKCGEGCLEGFRFPLLYYLTIPFYLVLGDLAFIVLPLVLFFGSIAFLLKILELAKLSPLWLMVLFLPMFFAPIILIHYTRDSLNFFLANAFAYYYISAYYFSGKVWPVLAILLLMLFANPQAIALAVLCLALVGKKNNALFPIIAPFSLLESQLRHYFLAAVFRLKSFQAKDLWYFALPFYNFFNVVSLACFLFNRNKLFGAILLSQILVAGTAIMVVNTMYPDPNPEQLAFRYGLEFVPLQYYFVAQTIKEKVTN